MTSFDELGLTEGLVEALAAEGFEHPTALQVGVIPVLLRGNHVLGEASSGAGLLLAFGAPFLDRIAKGEDQGALVLTADVGGADECARALAPIAAALDVRVAALDAHWARPSDAQILFGTAPGILDAVRTARLKLDRFSNLAVSDAAALVAAELEDEFARVAEHLGGGGPRAVFARPVDGRVEELAERLLTRAVQVPPRASSATGGGKATLPTVQPTGKTILYRLTGSDRRAALVHRLSEIEREGGRRPVVLFRTEDDVADVGDYVGLSGYATGALGDEDASVWIATDTPDAVAELGAADEPLSIVTYEGPGDERVFEAAANDGHEWLVLVRAAEVPHLRAVATAAGVYLRAAGATPSRVLRQDRAALIDRLRARLDAGHLMAYGALVEQLVDERDPLEVAAAALALVVETDQLVEQAASHDPAPQRAPPAAPVETFAKLFVSIGSRDGIRPGDLLGAVTGEAGIEGSQVGKIDVQESHSVVEVDGSVARRVIRALNGTSIRGRSLRVDLDRAHRRPASRSGPGRGRAPERGKPRR